jgi:hypothetical protein
MTSGSPGGRRITPAELPECIQDVLFQVDHHTSAFSVTSAAYDIYKIIHATQASHDVYVYALSYGTYLVERLLQFQSPIVRGYILDSIVSQSSPDWDHMCTFSSWDKDVAAAGTRFLAYCDQDMACHAKFHGRPLATVLKNLYRRYEDRRTDDDDDDHRRICQDLLVGLSIEDAGINAADVSSFLRSLLGYMLMNMNDRNLIPALIYRLDRCAPKDVRVLTYFIDAYIRTNNELMARWHQATTEDEALYFSELLYSLIVFSEMWETPSPSQSTLKERAATGLMAGGHTDAMVSQYCAFTGMTHTHNHDRVPLISIMSHVKCIDQCVLCFQNSI